MSSTKTSKRQWTATDLVEELEKIVDRNSLFDVLTALEFMCYEKEAHISEVWQDRTTAKTWKQDGEQIYSILEKIKN